MPPMDCYTGKRVWITGASTGLGRELSRLLLVRGARVVLTARTTAALEETAAEASPDHVKILPGDMERLDTLHSLAQVAWEAFGGLDLVIFNAGLSHRSLFVDTSPEVGKRILKVNLFSQIELTRHVFPRMKAQGSGRIVSVTSLAGKVASPLRSYYAAAKHGLHGFFKSLRVEAMPSKVGVTLVVPGFLRTDISKHALTADGGAWNRSDRNQLSGPSPEVAARKILTKIARGKRQIYVGYPFRAFLALAVGTGFPAVFDRILQKTDHT